MVELCTFKLQNLVPANIFQYNCCKLILIIKTIIIITGMTRDDLFNTNATIVLKLSEAAAQ